jgi:hypothetical protein
VDKTEHINNLINSVEKVYNFYQGQLGLESLCLKVHLNRRYYEKLGREERFLLAVFIENK